MIEEMKIKYNCEESYGCPNCRTKKCKNSCLNIVIAILAALFIGVIGVIIGAAISRNNTCSFSCSNSTCSSIINFISIKHNCSNMLQM